VLRDCTQVVPATHTFQAPGFYRIADYPRGHAQVWFVKQLAR